MKAMLEPRIAAIKVQLGGEAALEWFDAVTVHRKRMPCRFCDASIQTVQ
jgi:hypothetical protein